MNRCKTCKWWNPTHPGSEFGYCTSSYVAVRILQYLSFIPWYGFGCIHHEKKLARKGKSA